MTHSRKDRLQYVGNKARNIGLFVDENCSKVGTCLVINATEYGEIITDQISFTFIIDEDFQIFINGMGLNNVLIDIETDVEALLTKTLSDLEFVHTWVRAPLINKL